MRLSAVLPSSFALLMLTGCECPECPATDCATCPSPAVDCSTCATQAADPAWDAALTGLLGEPTTPPSGSSVNSPQVIDGEVNIWSPAYNGGAGAYIGDIFTVKTDQADPLWLENWILFSYSATTSPGQSFELRYCSSNCNALTAAQLVTYRGLETNGGTDYRFAGQPIEYRPFPTTAAIDALPAAPPAGATAFSFTVDTVQLSATPNTAYLYREVRDYAGYKVWTDHWVFTDAYRMVGPSASAQVKPAATPYTDLKTFLKAMDGLRAPNPKAADWRYVQSSYTWRDL